MQVQNMDKDVVESEYKIPADRIFAVIELRNDDGPYACIAPTNWLESVKLVETDDVMTKTAVCYWPVSETKLSDFVEKRRKPGDSPQWIKRSVPVLKLCKTYNEAKNYALNNSNISSSSATEMQKRKRKAVSRFLFDNAGSQRTCDIKRSKGVSATVRKNSIESDSDETDDPDGGYLISMGISANSINGNGNQERHMNDASKDKDQDDTSKDKDQDDTSKDKDQDDASKDKDQEDAPKDKDIVDVFNGSPIPEHQDEVECIQKCETPSGPKAVSVRSTSAGISGGLMDALPNGGRSTGNTRSTIMSPKKTSTPKYSFSPKKHKFGGHVRVVDGAVARDIAAMTRTLHRIDLKVDKLLVSSCPDIQLEASTTDKCSSIPALPILDDEGVAKFGTFVEDKHNSVTMVNYLIGFGSTMGRRATVNGILEKMISNKIAASYNFKGKNKPGNTPKKPFEQSPFFSILMAAVKKYAKPSPDAEQRFETLPKDVKGDIMAWLKDGPKRLASETKNVAQLD